MAWSGVPTCDDCGSECWVCGWGSEDVYTFEVVKAAPELADALETIICETELTSDYAPEVVMYSIRALATQALRKAGRLP